MLYHVAMKGRYANQAIVNNLYYQLGVGFQIGDLQLVGTKDVAECVRDQIWPTMRACLPTGYVLEAIDVYPIDQNTFDPFYQNPFSLPILEAGTVVDDTDGPALCAIIKFNLEPGTVFNGGFFPPKRGYVAIGPLVSTWVGNDGNFNDAEYLNSEFSLNALATELAANLEHLSPLAVFYPIRVSMKEILGVVKIVSYAGVGGAILRRRVSFRRSRLPE